jgi:hypothetical protein
MIHQELPGGRLEVLATVFVRGRPAAPGDRTGGLGGRIGAPGGATDVSMSPSGGMAPARKIRRRQEERRVEGEDETSKRYETAAYWREGKERRAESRCPAEK